MTYINTYCIINTDVLFFFFLTGLYLLKPGEGNGNPLQYSCLGNPTDGGARQATVHGVAKSWTQLSDDFTYLVIDLQ